jgi:hypothetical protein
VIASAGASLCSRARGGRGERQGHVEGNDDLHKGDELVNGVV